MEGREGPVFVYDPAIVASRVARFRAAFPSIDLHYAIKANPFVPLLAAMAAMVDGFDVASAGELAKVAPLGKPVSFAGPGKRDAELTAAIRAGVTVNLESEGEARRALSISEGLGVRPRLAVRVNPDVELRGSGMKMGGRPSPFGIDAERVPPLVRELIVAGADWRGFHIYAGSQALDPQAIIDTQGATIALAARLADAAGATPPLVNLGGGFGVPYFAGDKPLPVETVGAALERALATRPAILGDSRFAIELGRWLVAESGVYLARVIDRKDSGGDLPDPRRRAAPPAGGQWQFRYRRPAQLSAGGRPCDGGRAGRDGVGRGAALHPARPAGRPGRAPGGAGRRYRRGVSGRGLWSHRQPFGVSWPSPLLRRSAHRHNALFTTWVA
ncbi:hypothetical protein GCM10020258_01830 [Sphingomonas yabuuchiae]